MNSSTSSSDVEARRRLKMALGLFACLALSAGILKMVLVSSVPAPLRTIPQSFWVNKTHCSERFDLVAIGDSRTYRGIAPEVLMDTLTDYTCHNLGYNSAGLNNVMFKAAETLLDPRGERVILMGVSPLTLTASAGRNLDYRRWQSARSSLVHIPAIERVFARDDSVTAIKRFAGFFGVGSLADTSRGYFQIPHESGWVESWQVPEDPSRALALYRERFQQETVSPALQIQLFEQTRNWTQRGILVVAFRPPVTPEMYDLENALSGFHEAEFRTQFERAGGVWIEFDDPFSFHSYDGSHLRRDAAIRMSKYIAGAMRDRIRTLVDSSTASTDRRL